MYILFTKKCDKVISSTCYTFTTRFPEQQKPSPNTIKKIIKKSRILDPYEQECRNKASRIEHFNFSTIIKNLTNQLKFYETNRSSE